MRRIVRHPLKLEFSSAAAPRRGWFESINDARSEIEDLLETSLGLKGELGGAIPMALRQGSKLAISDLAGYREIDAATLTRIRAKTYGEEQLLADWFSPEPKGPDGVPEA
jgi:hypothetical protein